MLDEIREFEEYTSVISDGKQGRLKYGTITDSLSGLERSMTIIARWFLFDGYEESNIDDRECTREEYAQYALAVWCGLKKQGSREKTAENEKEQKYYGIAERYMTETYHRPIRNWLPNYLMHALLYKKIEGVNSQLDCCPKEVGEWLKAVKNCCVRWNILQDTDGYIRKGEGKNAYENCKTEIKKLELPGQENFWNERLNNYCGEIAKTAKIKKLDDLTEITFDEFLMEKIFIECAKQLQEPCKKLHNSPHKSILKILNAVQKLKNKKSQMGQSVFQGTDDSGNDYKKITYEKIIANAKLLGPLKRYCMVSASKDNYLGDIKKEKKDSILKLTASYLLEAQNRKLTMPFGKGNPVRFLPVNYCDITNWAKKDGTLKGKSFTGFEFHGPNDSEGKVFTVNTVGGNVSKVKISEEWNRLCKWQLIDVTEDDKALKAYLENHKNNHENAAVYMDQGSGKYFTVK